MLKNEDFVKLVPEEDLVKIIENFARRGYPCRTCTSGHQARYLDEILTDMETAAVKYGDDFKSAITGFKQGEQFSEGAEFVLDAITEYKSVFPNIFQ